MNTRTVWRGLITLIVSVVLLSKMTIPGAIALSIPLSPKVGLGAVAGDRAVEVRLEDLITCLWLVSVGLRRRRIMIPRPFVLFAVALVSAILSTFIGLFRGNLDISRALFYTLKEVQYLLLALIVFNDTATEQRRESATRMVVVAVCISGLLALGQLATGQFWGVAGKRASLPFDDGPFPLGGYAICGVALTFALIVVNMSWARLVSLSLAVAAVAISGSRSSIVGAMVAIATIAVLLSGTSIALRLRNLVFALLVGIGGVRLLMTTGIGRRFKTLFVADAGVGVRAFSFGSRAESMWPIWMYWFRQYPIMGLGISTIVTYGAKELTIADNYYVLMLGERGLVGSILFIGALVLWSGSLLRASRTMSGDGKAVVVAAIGAMSGFLVASIGTDAFRVIRPAEAFWYIQGLAASYAVANRGMPKPSS